MKSLDKYFESKIERMNDSVNYYIDHSDQFNYTFVTRALFDARDNVYEVLMYSNVWEMSIDDEEFEELYARLNAEYDRLHQKITDHFLPDRKGE